MSDFNLPPGCTMSQINDGPEGPVPFDDDTECQECGIPIPPVPEDVVPRCPKCERMIAMGEN